MRIPLKVLFLALCLAIPATAAASWGAKGDVEPSTSLDADGLYMFDTPNPTTEKRVYFNGFGGMCIGYIGCQSTSFNPNVGSLGTGTPVYPYQAYAMMGVWRDCNEDGFVGYGEQGLLDYSVRMPGWNATLCPQQSMSTGPCKSVPMLTCIENNAEPVHNDGFWVREFLPIGWGPNVASWDCPVRAINTCGDKNPYDFNDNGARVWADWGYPGDPPGNQCYVNPHPRGTWQSVGGMQAWGDCFLNGRVGTTIDSNGLRPTYDAVKGSSCEQSTALSYRAGCNPYGHESQKAYVDAFDCDPATRISGPNKAFYVPQPKPTPGANADGSMAGTMKETHGDFVGNCRENHPQPLPTGFAGPYSTEADLRNLDGPRDQHDMVMEYNSAARSPTQPYTTIAPGTANDLGLGTTRTGELWVGTSVTAASRNPFVDRAALGLGPAPLWSMTFYATLSTEQRYALQLPGSTPGTYGEEACGADIGPGFAPKKMWRCDDAEWWPGEVADCRPGVDDGCQRVVLGGETVEIFVRVGQEYRLRDVDCWDFSTTELRKENVQWGILTNTACT